MHIRMVIDSLDGSNLGDLLFIEVQEATNPPMYVGKLFMVCNLFVVGFNIVAGFHNEPNNSTQLVSSKGNTFKDNKLPLTLYPPSLLNELRTIIQITESCFSKISMESKKVDAVLTSKLEIEFHIKIVLSQ